MFDRNARRPLARSLAPVRARIRVYVTQISGIVGLIGIDLSDSVAARILTEATARTGDTNKDKREQGRRQLKN